MAGLLGFLGNIIGGVPQQQKDPAEEIRQQQLIDQIRSTLENVQSGIYKGGDSGPAQAAVAQPRQPNIWSNLASTLRNVQSGIQSGQANEQPTQEQPIAPKDRLDTAVQAIQPAQQPQNWSSRLRTALQDVAGGTTNPSGYFLGKEQNEIARQRLGLEQQQQEYMRPYYEAMAGRYNTIEGGISEATQYALDKIMEIAKSRPAILDNEITRKLFESAGIKIPNLDENGLMTLENATKMVEAMRDRGINATVEQSGSGYVVSRASAFAPQDQPTNEPMSYEDAMAMSQSLKDRGYDSVVKPAGQGMYSVESISPFGPPPDTNVNITNAFKLPPESLIKELGGLYDFQNKIQGINELFDPSAVGPWTGRAKGIMEKYPFLSGVLGQGPTEQQIVFRQITEMLADDLLRLRSGAQINEQEYQRMKGFMPQPNLPPETFMAKVQGLAWAINSMVKSKEQALRSGGYLAPQSEGGGMLPIPPKEPSPAGSESYGERRAPTIEIPPIGSKAEPPTTWYNMLRGNDAMNLGNAPNEKTARTIDTKVEGRRRKAMSELERRYKSGDLTESFYRGLKRAIDKNPDRLDEIADLWGIK